MGQCCSAPSADVQTVDIRARASIDLPRHHTDVGSDVVHILTTVRPGQVSSHISSSRHHHSSRSRSSSSSSSRRRSRKQLLRVASFALPDQQQQQHLSHSSLSPRSFYQLQQLLPSAPLQQLAAQHHHHHHPHHGDLPPGLLPLSSSPQLQQQHNHGLAVLLRSSSSGSGTVPGVNHAHNPTATASGRWQSSNLDASHLSASVGVDGFQHQLGPSHSTTSSSDTGTPGGLLRSSSSQTAAAAARSAGAPAAAERGHGQQQHGHSKQAAAAGGAVPAGALSPEQVLAVCGAVVQDEPEFQAGGITPLLLASLCLMESGGCPQAKQYKEHVGAVAHGLCQVLLSTAQWLATSKGFDRYGSSLKARDLEQPRACVYFCAAYLIVLSQHDGSPRSESFVVRAFHVGPKAVDSAAARLYLQKYLKAKHWLTEVTKAMARTLAAAALAARLPLQEPLEATGSAATLPPPCAATAVVHIRSKAESTAAGALVGGAGAAGGGGGGAVGMDELHKDQDMSSSNDKNDVIRSTKDVITGEKIFVRRATASLVAILSNDWHSPAQAAAAAAAITNSSAASSSGPGGFLAHMLPGRWSLGSSRQQQQQSASQTSCGSRSRNGHSGKEGSLTLAPVARAAIEAAWLRLLYISPTAAAAALEQAEAAVATAPQPNEAWQHPALSSNSTAAVAAARSSRRAGGSGSGSLVHSQAGSGTGSTRAGVSTEASAAATTAAAAEALDCLPCVMHVVGHGETLEHIASVCGVAVPDIRAANPDLPQEESVHQNDCIALPVPAVVPRLYVIQSGDTLHSIAQAHAVPLGRILARNPELADPVKVQPGWVVALPGLKGDSKSGLPMDWLAQAATAADTPPETQLAAAAFLDVDWEEEAAASPVHWQQQKGQQQQQRQRQQHPLATALSWSARVHQQQQWRQHQQEDAILQPCEMSPKHRSSLPGLSMLPTVGSGAFMFAVGDKI